MWTRRICCATLLLLLASLATAQVPCSPTLLPSPTLFVNWSQYGYDAAHTGCNPYETILSPSTVGNLTLKWAFEAGVAGVPSSPAVANGMAYFASVTKTLTAVNAATGVLLWQYQLPNSAWHSPAVANGIVYIGVANTDGQNFFALNASNGTVIWTQQVGGGPTTSPVVVNGVVYVAGMEDVHALDAATGKILWNYYDSIVASELVVANGNVYFGAEDNFYALDAATGTLKWRYPTGSVAVSAVVANNVVYFASDGLYAVKADTGALVWQETVGAGVAPLAIAKGVLYAGGDDYYEQDNNFYALNAATGAILWHYPTGLTRTPVAVADGVVYVGANYSFLYALNANNGLYLWSHDTGEELVASPVVANGTLYVGSWDNDSHLFAFHLPGQ